MELPLGIQPESTLAQSTSTYFTRTRTTLYLPLVRSILVVRRSIVHFICLGRSEGKNSMLTA